MESRTQRSAFAYPGLHYSALSGLNTLILKHFGKLQLCIRLVPYLSASGVPTPRSDVDLLIVTERSNWEDLQTEFLSVSVPVDCHLVSPAAFKDMSASGKGIVGAAVRNGIRLL